MRGMQGEPGCLTDFRAGDNGGGGESQADDWFREVLQENAHFEQDEQMLERVRRVEDRLQSDRPKGDRKIVEIPWIDEFNAFAINGKYIYIARRLYQLCDTDDEVAFVIAHELAHYDLGHLDIFDGWMDGLRSVPGAVVLAAVFQILESRVYGLDKECDADRHALMLCAKAGYDPRACLCFFDILEEHILNLGGFDQVYGLEVENDRELCEDTDWITRLKIWTWHRWNGYLPIRDRRQMLLEYLEKIAVFPQSGCETIDKVAGGGGQKDQGKVPCGGD
jgi:hypothetical protein